MVQVLDSAVVLSVFSAVDRRNGMNWTLIHVSKHFCGGGAAKHHRGGRSKDG
jgi:hypothetical protein